MKRRLVHKVSVKLGVFIVTYLAPKPITTPAVKNKPPTLLVVNPLNISPAPKNPTPSKAVFLAPIFRINLALSNARKEIQAHVRLPTKLIVAGEDRFRCTRAAWIIPHE